MAFQNIMPGITNDQRVCKVAYGTFTWQSTTTGQKITVGFKPKQIYLLGYNLSTGTTFSIAAYDVNLGTTVSFRGGSNAGSAYSGKTTIPATAASTLSIYSVDDDGFTIGYTTTAVYLNSTCYYTAIG